MVDTEIIPVSNRNVYYNFWTCCWYVKWTLGRKGKDWLAQNQDNVSEWGDMSIRKLLFQWASTIKMQVSMLV
jgi:hypothetical protein